MKKNSFFLAIALFASLGQVNAESSQGSAPVSKTEILLRQGSDFQNSGYYLDAQTTYQTALTQAEQQQDFDAQALAKGALGYIAYLLHRPGQAAPLLEQALVLAKRTKKNDLVTVIKYYSGLTAQSRNLVPQAQAYLQQALDETTQAHNVELMVRCHLALAQMAQNVTDFKHHQQLALTRINQLEPSAVSGELLLLLAEQWLDHPLLPPLTVQNGQENQRLATLYQQLALAFSQLPAEQHRSIAQYYGLLGRVYESQQRNAEALTLTQAAVERLQTINADDLKIFYNWQAARLYTALQQRDAAIDSYRRAITAIQNIRQDIPVTYQNGKSSFLQVFGPLYRGAVTLLLQPSTAKETVPNKPLLEEARGLMERLKQTELEDFFKDRCLLADFQVNATRPQGDKTAVFYPIMLADRIELLLSIGDRLYQYTVKVDSDTLDKQIRIFAKHLRNGQEDQPAAQRLYEWLVRPLEQQLKDNAIDTLVYVPDGPLRLLPLASLTNGEHYLVEHYAITTTTSLAATSATVKTSATKTLLVGLSQPGPDVVAQLPDKLLTQLKGEEVVERGVSGMGKSIAVRSVAARLREFASPASATPAARNLQEIMKSLTLPGVKVEIDTLAAKMPSQVIFNQDYTLQNFDRAVKQADYGTVHIASHGFFGSSSDDSFIMTYDKLLDIDHLEALLKDRSLAQPIDLLVLSSCQTAEGDDRAPLGLTGIALKAKAKNALGSLWPISDDAAVKIMQKFYDGFIHHDLTKAKALQQAQLQLLQDKEFSHPFYWAPFILVGNGG
jgi:CHAT domain-containing protein